MARNAIVLALVVCTLAIPACQGVGHPFAAKASLMRFWRRTLPDVKMPGFLWDKASPLNATSVALFNVYLANHTLSDHIASLCTAADLLCTRRVADDEKAVSVSGPSDFESYHGKKFKTYKAEDNTFKNYSDNDNVVKDGFKGYGPESGGLQTFRNYAPGANVADEGFATYGTGSNGALDQFNSYGHQTNVPDDHFKNYGTDSNGLSESFTSYADDSNVIKNGFATYGKNSNAIFSDFTSYANNSNVITNDFKAYSEKGNGAFERFTSYAENGNVLLNEFQKYGTNGNGALDTFTSYATDANQPMNVFKSYGKDANAPNFGFSNYGKNVPGAANEFAQYAKGSNSQTVGFTSYSPNSTFSDSAKTGVTFSDYANKTLSSAAGVEPGKFFRENMLVQGGNVPFPDIRDYMPKRSFLPRSLADNLPFRSQNLSSLISTFRIPENSSMSSIMARTLRECERPPVKGEIKKCVTSVEGMAEFAASVLGSKVEVLTTQSTAGSKETVQIGKVEGKDGGKVTRSVSCHQSLFPYLVYYCHSVPKVRVHEAALLANGKKINDGIAICHLDTTQWSARHAAFSALGHKPGEIEVCHWIFENDLIWVPLPV